MRYGISVPNIGELALLVELGVEADRRGWDGFFLWDHIRFSTQFPVTVFDPWVTLGAVAARTESVRLGTLVTPLPRRRPWKLARETVTLDHLSGGRAVLGVGLGYPPDAEFASLGEDPDERVRAAKLDEGLEVLIRLWSGEPFDFEGEYYRIRRAAFLPTPVQQPRLPVWVAGMWPHRAPFRRAARYDGVVPIAVDDRGTPSPLDQADLADVVAYVRENRPSGDPFDVVHSGPADPDAVRASRAAGATWYLADAGIEGPGWEAAMLDLVRSGPPRG